MVAKKTKISFTSEHIRNALIKLFKSARIGPDYYRILIKPSEYRNAYEVTLVCDEFEQLSITSRQVWIWERLKKFMPQELINKIGVVYVKSVRELAVSDELALTEHENVSF